MEKMEMSAIEKEMASFDLASLQTKMDEMKASAATTESLDALRSKICETWSKIRKFVDYATKIPVAGRYIAIARDLLDMVCGNRA